MRPSRAPEHQLDNYPNQERVAYGGPMPWFLFYSSSERNSYSTSHYSSRNENTCWHPKPRHLRALDFSLGPSQKPPGTYSSSCFQIHTSHPFIGKPIRKPRVGTVPPSPTYSQKRPPTHFSKPPNVGSSSYLYKPYSPKEMSGNYSSTSHS